MPGEWDDFPAVAVVESVAPPRDPEAPPLPEPPAPAPAPAPAPIQQRDEVGNVLTFKPTQPEENWNEFPAVGQVEQAPQRVEASPEAKIRGADIARSYAVVPEQLADAIASGKEVFTSSSEPGKPIKQIWEAYQGLSAEQKARLPGLVQQFSGGKERSTAASFGEDVKRGIQGGLWGLYQFAVDQVATRFSDSPEAKSLGGDVRGFQQLQAIAQGADPTAGKDAGFAERALHGTVGQLPVIAGSIASGGLGLAGKVGSGLYWLTQGSSLATNTLRDAGVDETKAKNLGLAAGIPWAVLAELNVAQVAPGLMSGTKAVIEKTVLEGLKEYGVHAGTALGAQATQALLVKATKAAGVYLDEKAPGMDWAAEAEDFSHEIKEMIGPTLLMTAGGHALTGLSGSKTQERIAQAKAFVAAFPEAAQKMVAKGAFALEMARGVPQGEIAPAEPAPLVSGPEPTSRKFFTDLGLEAPRSKAEREAFVADVQEVAKQPEAPQTTEPGIQTNQAQRRQALEQGMSDPRVDQVRAMGVDKGAEPFPNEVRSAFGQMSREEARRLIRQAFPEGYQKPAEQASPEAVPPPAEAAVPQQATETPTEQTAPQAAPEAPTATPLRTDLEAKLGHKVRTHPIHPELIEGKAAATKAVEIATSRLAGEHRAYMVGFDTHNQKGINDFFGSEPKADKAFMGPMVDILNQELKKTGLETTIFKHGGDEMAAVLEGKGQGHEAAIQEALDRARTRVDALRASLGMPEDLENPRAKKPYEPNPANQEAVAAHKDASSAYLAGRGVGVRVGVAELANGDSFDTAWNRISETHVKLKKEGLPNVARQSTPEPGAVAPVRAGAGQGVEKAPPEAPRGGDGPEPQEGGQGGRGVPPQEDQGAGSGAVTPPKKKILRPSKKGVVDETPIVGNKVYYIPKGLKKEYPGRVVQILDNGKMVVEPLKQPTSSKGFRNATGLAKTGIGPEIRAANELRINSAEYGRRARQAEIETIPAAKRSAMRKAEQDANSLIDDLNAEKIDQVSAQAQGKEKDVAIARSRMRGEFLDKAGLSRGVKAKVDALPLAIEKTLEAGVTPELKSVEFKNAFVDNLEPGDKIRLAGDTFTVKESDTPGKVRLKDHIEIEVPEDQIPVDKGSRVKRVPRIDTEDTPGVEGYHPDVQGMTTPLNKQPMPANLPKGGEGISPYRIIDQAAKDFGVTVRSRHMTLKKAAGQYANMPETIRAAPGYEADLATFSHELAHHVDKLNKLSDVHAPPDVVAEMKTRDYQPKKARAHEGFAEYMRHRLTENDPAGFAPKTHAWFEQWLKGQPEMAGKLEKLKGQIDQWRNQGAESRLNKAVRRDAPLDLVGKGKEALFAVQKAMVDRFQGLKNFSEAVNEQRAAKGLKPLPEGVNPYRVAEALAENAPGMGANAVEEGVFSLKDGRRMSEGIKQTFDKLQLQPGELQKFSNFMVARHARDIYKSGRKFSVSLADANHVYDQYKATPGWTEAAESLTKWNKSLVEMYSEIGGLSPESTKAILESFPAYVPLQRVLETVSGKEGQGGIVEGKNPVGRMSKTGSALEIHDPFGVMLASAAKFYDAANKLTVAKSIVDAGMGVEGLGKWIEKIPTPKKIVKTDVGTLESQLGKAGADLSNADMTAILNLVQDSSYKGSEPIVTLFRNGKAQTYQLHPELYDSMKRMDTYKLPAVLEATFGAVTKLKRLGAVEARPSFGLAANPARDLPLAMIQTEGSMAKMMYRTLGNYFRVGYAHAMEAAGKHGGNDVYLDLAKKWGSESGMFVGQDFDHAYTKIKEVVNDVDQRRLYNIVTSPKELMKVLLQTPGKMIGAVREVVGVTEMGPRLAEMQARLEKRGITRADLEAGKQPSMEQMVEALTGFKNITTNFGRKGTVMQAVNRVEAFSNAKIQGFAQPAANLAANPVRFISRAIGMLTLPAVASWLMNRKEDWYQELPAWQKVGFWNFKVGDKVVRIPKPFEVGAMFASLPEAVLESLSKKDPKRAEQFAKEVAPDASSLFKLMPDAVLPAIEILTNYDSFRKRAIIGEGLTNREPKDQFNEWNSAAAKYLAAYFNDGRKPEAQVSPAKLDHLFSSYTGGLGPDLANIGEQGPAKALGYGRFSKVPAKGESIDEFYAARDAAEQAKNSAKDRGDVPQEIADKAKHLKKYADLLSGVRDYAHNLPTQELKDSVNKYLTSLSRQALGKEPLNRDYPNFFTDANLPSGLKDVRDEWLKTALDALTDPRPLKISPKDKKAGGTFQDTLKTWQEKIDEAKAELKATGIAPQVIEGIFRSQVVHPLKSSQTKFNRISAFKKRIAG